MIHAQMSFTPRDRRLLISSSPHARIQRFEMLQALFHDAGALAIIGLGRHPHASSSPCASIVPCRRLVSKTYLQARFGVSKANRRFCAGHLPRHAPLRFIDRHARASRRLSTARLTPAVTTTPKARAPGRLPLALYAHQAHYARLGASKHLMLSDDTPCLRLGLYSLAASARYFAILTMRGGAMLSPRRLP